MADSDRSIFPLETVLALVTGKEGVDVKGIAGYVTGRSIVCDCQAKAVAPFAAAWLARWYPKFTELVWSEDQSWDNFVALSADAMGDNVSITPMDGRTKALALQVLDAMAEAKKNEDTQTDIARKLDARVKELEPLEALSQELQKKVDSLEENIKAMKADMGGLRRQVGEYQGKVAIDHDELMQTIKSAIKDGMKGMVVAGGAAAGAAAGADAGEAAPAEEGGVPDDFGFGDSGANSDGFGF